MRTSEKRRGARSAGLGNKVFGPVSAAARYPWQVPLTQVSSDEHWALVVHFVAVVAGGGA